MSTLTGIEVNASYKNLLQVSNANAGVDATLRDVEDGEGTVSALKLSTLAAKVTGTFEATTSVVTPIIDSGTTGSLSLRTNNGTFGLEIVHLGGGVNWHRMFAGGAGGAITFLAAGEANTSLDVIMKGAGSFFVKGGATDDGGTGSTTQFRVVPTAGSTRWIDVTGSAAGNPTITTTAGSLAITPAVVLTAGQLSFPATQNPSADANTLDDYEEGTWTPTVLFNGASVGVTYTIQTGSYTKIGNRVFFEFAITLSSKGSSTGIVAVGGIPFNVGSTVVPPHSVYWANLNSSFVYMIGMPGSAFADRISILGIAAAAQTVSQALDTDFSNTTQIVGAGVYSV